MRWFRGHRERTEEDRRFAALYHQYGSSIYARCLKILKEPAAAEDATQEVFLRVWRSLENVPESERALRWIYRVSTNYCLNVLRSRRRRPEVVGPVPERVLDSVEEALANREAVLFLLQRAPTKLQEVALMVYLDGLQHEEVAEVLGITSRTVINRLQAFNAWAQRFFYRQGVGP